MVRGKKIAVSVRYHNMLRHRAGVAQETVTLPASAGLHTALTQLAERHGASLREMLFGPDGEISSHLVIFHNHKLVHQHLIPIAFSDGDQLLLFPAIAGG